MIITIGSRNPNKVQAVKEALAMFGQFRDAHFESVAVSSGVSDQPIGFEETLGGARQRAANAFSFSSCDMGIGLESGLIPVPLTRSGYMNLSVCAVYNGKDHFVGLGPGFELPEAITRLVIGENMELDEAIFTSGFSDNPRIGYSEGIIGVLTDGAVTRKDYMIPAVSMAMASYLHSIKDGGR